MTTGLPTPADPPPDAARKGTNDPLDTPGIPPRIESAVEPDLTLPLTTQGPPPVPGDNNGDGRPDRNGKGDGRKNNKDNDKNKGGLDPTAERALIAAGSIGRFSLLGLSNRSD